MTELEPSTLRILNATGQTIGTGFLLSSSLAITCAHVVASAGAVDGDTIQVQFSGRSEIIEALIEPKFWRETKKGDLAFLRLAQIPSGVIPLRLGLAEHSREGNIFRSFGYATAAGMQGIKANGSIDGYLRQHELVQLQSPQTNHGISGAPVWDEQRGVVIGMITKGHTELGRNQETTFATPAELLFEVCSEIQPSEICPYLGLESFSAETERFFFGRTALTEKLLTTLSRGCRFLAVFGPSGSGKSSVMRAGLLPALNKSQPSWAQIIIRPADDPFAQLGAAGLDLSNIPTTKTVLFIDQFEELFTCSEDIRERFVRELAAALENSRLILIIAMRDDFYSAFNAKAALLAASPDKVVVDVPVTLERADLIAMIEQPAAAVGLALEEGLTDAIIKDATTDGSARSSTLPLLEFALTQLWDKRRDGLLTHDAYQLIGGVTGSLARWADDAYSDLPKADQPLAESLLTALVHLGDEAQGLPDTRRRRAKAEFDEATQNVITHFANRRLLVTSGKTVELTHDALVRGWGRLQNWIKSDRDNLRLREGVNDAAQDWETADRDENLLVHRGPRLQLGLAIGKLPKYRLNRIEQNYLNNCVAVTRKRTLRILGLMLVILVITLSTFIPTLNMLLRWRAQELGQMINLGKFNIEQFEVTNERYKLCLQAGQCPPPVDQALNNHPRANITWLEASQFCSWIGRSLPTDSEWDRAAQYTDDRPWPWGKEYPTSQDQHAVLDFSAKGCLNSREKPCTTKDVGTFKDGRSEEYVYDLIGNVSEWTCTPSDSHPDACFKAGDKPVPNLVTTRGFGADTLASGLTPPVTSSYKSGTSTNISSEFIGFRCVEKTNP